MLGSAKSQVILEVMSVGVMMCWVENVGKIEETNMSPSKVQRIIFHLQREKLLKLLLDAFFTVCILTI